MTVACDMYIVQPPYPWWSFKRCGKKTTLTLSICLKAKFQKLSLRPNLLSGKLHSPLRKPLAEHPCHSRLPLWQGARGGSLPPHLRSLQGSNQTFDPSLQISRTRDPPGQNLSSLEDSLLDWMAAAAGRAGRLVALTVTCAPIVVTL